MRVVITGAAGFIGSNLARYWRTHHPEDEVIGFDLLTYAGRPETLEDLTGTRGFTLVMGDITDPPAVKAALRDTDLVLHLAAETHNDRAIADPQPFLRTNIIGTSVLLEAVRQLDIPRFHHVSTDEVFGSLPLNNGEKFTEKSQYQPRGPYAASKAAADHLVRAWHETYGLGTTLSNSSNNFGPFQFPEKLIPRAILRLLAGRSVPVYGDGLNVRDWIYVEDHAEAIERVALHGKVGATYLVSADCERSNLEVVRTLLQVLNASDDRIEFVPDRPGHDRRYALDARRLREELDWRPRHEFKEALASTVVWYRNHSDWWRPIAGVGDAASISAPTRGTS